jgi:hypothetical protein
MLNTHKKRGKYFWSFLSFANFYFFILFCFMHKVLKAVKNIRYKIPLVEVLPQASFRLTAAGRGCNPSNGSKPPTPTAAAAASAS